MKKDTLGLYGPEDSAYLRLVECRAEEAGIKTAWVAGPTPGCAAYLADTEAGWPLWDLTDEEDVDKIQHPGLSCCAAGALKYASCVGDGSFCIIGRGHAVQGLAERLEEMGVSVEQCSSADLSIPYRAVRANVIVNSAKAVAPEVLKAVPKDAVVLDISGSMADLRGRRDCGYVSRGWIGGWNVTVLLTRVKDRMREEERDGD